jgi:hypothetical protein
MDVHFVHSTPEHKEHGLDAKTFYAFAFINIESELCIFPFFNPGTMGYFSSIF